MLYKKTSDSAIDPVDGFYEVLHLVWEVISRNYGVMESLPDTRSLLEGVEHKDPCVAAEMVICNMLMDITQLVDRFSPWYTRPPRSFGLVSFRDMISHKTKWRLAPEAQDKWQYQIDMLAEEFAQKSGLIEAIALISDLDILDECPTDVLIAMCECNPPKEIMVTRSFLKNNHIVCNECKEQFDVEHQS